LRQRRSAQDKAAGNRRKALAAVAARLSGFRPAHDVLVRVKAVRTIFPWINLVSRVGGWPMARFTLAHGKSSHGKTEFAHGLGASFLAADGFYTLIDAEQTTPFDWPATLLGPELSRSPGFLATRSATYEEVRGEVRRFCETVAEARNEGEIDPETPALIVVDSIRKLVPEKIWDELTKEAEGKAKRGRNGQAVARGIDGMGGRAAQIKAALNAAWLDELIPLLGQTDCTMLCIARQTLDDDGNVKIGGGGALVYDSSMVVEVERDSLVTDGGEGRDATVYGERHAVVVKKSKLAGREEKWPTAYYHSSNGRLVPAGFDRPRDLLDMALAHGVAEKAGGGWISLDGEKLGQGANKVVQLLHAKPELLARLESAVLERQPSAPAEVIDAPAEI